MASTITGAEDAETFVDRMRMFYRSDQLIAASVLVVGVGVILGAVDSAWTIAVLAIVVANIVVIEWFHRRIDTTNAATLAPRSIVVVWATCILLSPLVSFALPALVMAVLISLLAVIPVLSRREVIRTSIGGAVVLGLAATLAYSIEGPIDEEIPDWLGNVITTVFLMGLAVPMGALAWDIHTRQTIAVTRMAEANAALRESRARLVDVADEERRRIERNLHDGAQQRFVGLTMQLRLLSRAHPEVADDVGELVDELQEALDEVRALAHGIYPPLLRARGLPEALHAAARRAPIEVTVAATTTRRYSQRIEVAIYFCCLEAIQNAAKYGGEGVAVTIEVEERDQALGVGITDNGVGFDPRTVTDGTGLRNMADRLAAVDAALSIHSAPGSGTVVSTVVAVPTSASPEQRGG